MCSNRFCLVNFLFLCMCVLLILFIVCSTNYVRSLKARVFVSLLPFLFVYYYILLRIVFGI